MVSTEVQRTLVKSPPELWAELSDPAALARHLSDLGDIGEIRVTRVHAEERVEWEGNHISGTVLMKASGWGTKVTLRVSKELGVEPAYEPTIPTDDASAENAQSIIDEQPVAEIPVAHAEPNADANLAADTERVPRRGFFARLFRRRPAAEAEPAPPALGAEAAAEPVAAALPAEPVASAEPAIESQAVESATADEFSAATNTPVPADPTAPSADPPAELKDAEETATEQVTEVLTATLDRLGAAHHRPFSRA